MMLAAGVCPAGLLGVLLTTVLQQPGKLPQNGGFRVRLAGQQLTAATDARQCWLMPGGTLLLMAHTARGDWELALRPDSQTSTLPLSAETKSAGPYARLRWFPQGVGPGRIGYESVSGRLELVRYDRPQRRVSATFRGQLRRLPGHSAGPAAVMITDGVFTEVTFSLFGAL